MNEAQKRHIAATFEHVDGLLQAAASSMKGGATESPFNRFVLDTNADQRRLVEEEVQNIRGLMVAAMARLGIPLPEASVSTTHSVRTDILFAEVDIEDIEPKRLRDYGELRPDDAVILAEINAGLLKALGRMGERLDAG